jgi:peptidoglycan/xylan/chitin deacetylase (PgdA/CDA1 family)
MSFQKQVIRGFILPLALNFKTDKYLLKKSRKSCCIINFHGVRKNGTIPFNNRHMPVSDFEKMLVYLKKNYTIVPLSEIFEIHRSKRPLKRKTIALTFDDGYENNFDIAFPLLKKHNIPATFYLISKGLNSKNYLVWPDALDLVKKHHKEDIQIDNVIFRYPSFVNSEMGLDLFSYLKSLGDQAEYLTNELLHRYHYHIDEIKKIPELLLLVNAEKLSRFINEPLLELGSHSHTHFNMEYLSKEKALEELVNSKRIIENLTGRPVISLAFPDGSYSPETVELAVSTGYSDISAVEYKHNENNLNPNLLSRFTISNSTTYESNAIRLAKQFDLYGFN